MSSGKWLIFGLYDRIDIQGATGVHDLAFYAKIFTLYEGKLDLTLAIYNRQEGNANPRPQVQITAPMTLSTNPGVLQDAIPGYEAGLTVQQAHFHVTDEQRIKQEDTLIPFDAVLSTNGNEIARCRFSVAFHLKPQVKTSLI
jgi:hypothetical protein